MGITSCVLMYNSLSSASVANDITALMSWAMLWTAQLFAGLGTSDDMKKMTSCATAFVLLEYDALL